MRLLGFSPSSFFFFLLCSTLSAAAVTTGCGATSDADPASGVPSPEAGTDASPPSAKDAASPEDAAPDAPVLVPSVDAAGVCTAAAQKTCAFLTTCAPTQVDGIFATPADCVPRFESICIANYPVGAAVRKDDADAFVGCLGSLTCDALYGPTWPTKCERPRLQITKAVGAACRIDAECTTGSCSGTSTTCGTCMKRVAAGDPCTSSAQCAAAGYCNTKCYAAAFLGDSCDTYNVCGNGLKCTAGKCAKLAGEGTTCNDDLDCDVTKLIRCNRTTKLCESATLLQPGETCPYPFAGSPALCMKGSHCIGDSPTQSGTCIAPQKVGESCDAEKRCESFINCRGGKCVLPTYVACP